jgi:hypothetical protein
VLARQKTKGPVTTSFPGCRNTSKRKLLI